MAQQRERNLLFAVFAVQLKGVSPQRAMEAASAWSVDPSRSLAQRLMELGALSAADVELLEHLVDEAIRSCHGNVDAALESIRGVEGVRKTLSGAAGVGPKDPTRFMQAGPEASRHGPELAPVEEHPGRYSHISEQGRGGMGRVLLVHDQCLGRDIALKELLVPHDPQHAGAALSPMGEASSLLVRFLQEARITSQLEHPSIVPVYELGQRSDGTLYYTMRLVRGKTLSNAIRQAGALRERLKYLPNLLDLCQAIAYAHSRGVIHRDIKPSNIMVGEFGETVVLDWGLAKALDQEDVNSEKLEQSLRMFRLQTPVSEGQTVTGEAIGTPHYMPPEQARGHIADIDQRSDVYAAGAVLYELLTGKPPFEGETVKEILDKVISGEPAPVDTLTPGAPPELVSICAKAIQRNPAQRYQTMSELRDELLRFQAGAFVQAYQYSIGETLTRYYRQHRAVLNTAAAGVMALFLLGVFSYVNIWRAERREHVQRVIAEDARSKAERSAYLSQLHLAQSYLAEKHSAQANEALWATQESSRGWEWGYLLNQANPELFTVEAPGAQVRSAVFSRDGKWIGTFSLNDPSKIYDAATGALRSTLELSGLMYNCSAFSPDGAYFAAGSVEGPVDIWDAATGKRVVQLPGTTTVFSLVYEPETGRLVTGTQDGFLRFWNPLSGKLESEAQMGNGALCYAVPVPGTQRWLFTGETNAGGLWDAAESRMLFQFEGLRVVPNPQGTLFAAAQKNDAVIFDAATGQERHRLAGHGDQISDMKFNPSGTRLLTASWDGYARLWDVESGEELRAMSCAEPVSFVFFLDQGDFAVTVGDKNNYTLWSIPDGRMIHTMPGRGDLVQYAQLSPNGRHVAIASGTDFFQVWDMFRSASETDCRFMTPTYRNILETYIQGVEFSPSNELCAVHFTDSAAALVRSADLTTLANYQVPRPDSFSDIAFSLDASRVAALPDAASVLVWTLPDNRPLTAYLGHDAPVKSLAFQPTGAVVASGSADGTVHLWDASTGALERIIDTRRGPVHEVAFSLDGQTLITACEDNAAVLWSMKDGSAKAILTGHEKPVISAAFDPKGRYAVTASSDGALGFWNPEDGACIRMLHLGRTGSVDTYTNKSRLRLNQMGDVLVVPSPYQGAQVWDTMSGDFLFSMPRCFWFETQSGQDTGLEFTGSAIRRKAIAPWNAGQWAAYPGSTDQERYRAYRKPFMERLEGIPGLLETREIIVPTGRQALIDACANLRRAAEMLPAAATGKGFRIGAGPALVAGVPLGLADDDDVTGINGVPVDGPAAMAAALQDFEQRLADAQQTAFTLAIQRGGRERSLEYQFFPEKTASASLNLSSGQAAALFRFLQSSYSQCMTDSTYLRYYDHNALLMIEIEGNNVLHEAGLLNCDRITALNGQLLRDMPDIKETLVQSEARAASGEPFDFTVDLRRGILQTRHMEYHVVK